MTDFKLSVYRLLQNHPLYTYRSKPSNSNAKLSILLIGYGSRMDIILDVLLTNGLLLNTDLDITVANTNSSGTANAIMKRAPYLKNFVQMICNGVPLSEPKTDCNFATLRFDTVRLTPEAMPNILEERFECSYVFIATGNDEQNHTLAEACAQYAADHSTFITYVHNKVAEEITVLSSLSEVKALRTKKDEEYRKQIEQIAFNLHYCYAKAADERATYSQIWEEFSEPYTYLSNIGAALHIRSKLASCGIIDDDLATAAEKFFKLISDQPNMLHELSALEHRRWVIEKCLQGYVQLDDFNLLYQNGATTHSTKDKWHTCLVPYGTSKLALEDWEGSTIRPDLDDLDCISLKIHEKCRQISTITEHQVSSLIRSLKATLTENMQFSLTTLNLANELECLVLQIRQNKRSAISLYRKTLTDLAQRINSEGGLLTSVLDGTLKTLDTALSPLITYVSCKDFKYQDQLLVEQIPFALTHKPRSSLMKVFSTNNHENLLSSWQIEPYSITFLCRAQTVAEIDALKEKASQFSSYLDNVDDLRWLICIPPHLLAAVKDTPGFFFIEVPSWTLPDLSNVLSNAIDFTIDYLDITGSDLLLSRAAEGLIQHTGGSCIYVQNGHIYNLYGSNELQYHSPRKNITIREMFALNGAVYETSVSSKSVDLSSRQNELWTLQNKYKYMWNSFCKAVEKAHSSTEKHLYSCALKQDHTRNTLYNGNPNPLYSTNSNYSDTAKFSGVPRVATAAILPILRELEVLGYLAEISVGTDIDGTHSISYKVLSKDINRKGLFGFIKAFCYKYQPDFSVCFDKRKCQLVCDELKVENMPTIETAIDSTGNPIKNEYDQPIVNRYYLLLQELNNVGLICNYSFDKETNLCSFSFASSAIAQCLKKSGDVLEYYLYYTALMNCNFTDVDMGFEFRHAISGEKAHAKNEIDVICTRGDSSLFISAKLRGEDSFKDNQLNYILYEIALEAKQFGLNAKPILAAPALKQFESSNPKKRSDYAKRALSRGVYLVGEECLHPSILPQVLMNIMDGREDWCEIT